MLRAPFVGRLSVVSDVSCVPLESGTRRREPKRISPSECRRLCEEPARFVRLLGIYPSSDASATAARPTSQIIVPRDASHDGFLGAE